MLSNHINSIFGTNKTYHEKISINLALQQCLSSNNTNQYPTIGTNGTLIFLLIGRSANNGITKQVTRLTSNLIFSETKL
jgi:hypothetical protein